MILIEIALALLASIVIVIVGAIQVVVCFIDMIFNDLLNGERDE